jgi:hypothetical protein
MDALAQLHREVITQKKTIEKYFRELERTDVLISPEGNAASDGLTTLTSTVHQALKDNVVYSTIPTEASANLRICFAGLLQQDSTLFWRIPGFSTSHDSEGPGFILDQEGLLKSTQAVLRSLDWKTNDTSFVDNIWRTKSVWEWATAEHSCVLHLQGGSQTTRGIQRFLTELIAELRDEDAPYGVVHLVGRLRSSWKDPFLACANTLCSASSC